MSLLTSLRTRCYDPAGVGFYFFKGLLGGVRAFHDIPAVKSTSEFPLAPSISAFNLSTWLGSLTDISFCSPWRFTV